MIDFAAFGLALNIVLFLASAAAIAYAGVKLSYFADELADRTGLGEIVAGALFVGASTSLPGVLTSVLTAAQGYPSIAVGNALGGLTVQTLWIVIADFFYRRANLEHAAATPVGMAQGIVFIALLCVALIASMVPGIALWGIHPASLVIPVGYIFALFLLNNVKQEGMWEPVDTDETAEEESDPELSDERRATSTLWGLFAVFAGITAVAGYCIGQSSIALVEITGVSQTLFGTTLTAIANSLPELVTAIAAVRLGAVNLAVGDIIGGNAFDALFLSMADLAYPDTIYSAMSRQDQATALFAILMVAVLLLGMLKRDRGGALNVGFEGVTVITLYILSVAMLFF